MPLEIPMDVPGRAGAGFAMPDVGFRLAAVEAVDGRVTPARRAEVMFFLMDSSSKF